MTENDFAILVVDDDEVDVMSIKRTFTKLNVHHLLYTAANGLEALAMLRGEGRPALSPLPGLILLDLNMPMMDGLEFLKELRADPRLKSLTVVVLTTSNDERDKRKAYESHVAGYLVKPVTGAEFLEMMRVFNRYWTMSELPPLS